MEISTLSVLENTLSRLQAVYWLTDASGCIMLPAGAAGETLPAVAKACSSEGQIFRRDEMLIFKIGSTPRMFFVLKGGQKDLTDVGLMACAYIKTVVDGLGGMMDKDEFYRRALLGNVSQAECESYCEKFGIDPAKERCCMVISDKNGMMGLMDMLYELIPRQQADTVVAVDATTVCIILAKGAELKPSEHIEFAAAIESSAMEAGATNVKIGIGDSCKTFLHINESYDEAVRAIQLGQVYAVKGNIYDYKNLLIERMLDELGEENCRKYYQMLFNKKNSKLFNEEMLRTIRIFMECNLNLSEAARYIFIHRNTLVYRLDKIQDATGLDLRVFDDAAKFKFLMQLGRRLNIHEKGETGR